MKEYRPIIGLTLNYRDANRTIRCIDSMLSEGVSHVLIWDNSEDNGTSGATLSSNLSGDPKVSVKVSPTNLGFAAGVNRGIEWIMARFDQAWVLLLNNDARLLPGAIFSLSEALSRHSQAVIAYPKINHAGRILGTVYYQRHTGLLTTRPLPGSFPYASGCCQLIAVERCESPIFDEDFFMYGEDWAQGWTLGEKQIAHVPQPLVVHEGSASSGLGSEFYEMCILIGHWILSGKISQSYYGRVFTFLGHYITLAGRAILRSVRYQSITPLCAFQKSHDRIKRAILRGTL